MRFVAALLCGLLCAAVAQGPYQLAYYGVATQPNLNSLVNATAVVMLAVGDTMNEDGVLTPSTIGRMLFAPTLTGMNDRMGADALFNDSFEAHVHANSCDVNNAGPHWQLVPNPNDVTETNEFHFYFNGSMGAPASTPGRAYVDFRVNFNFEIPDREDVQSVVVHFPDNARAFCVDLTNAFSQSYMLLAETLQEQVEVTPVTDVTQGSGYSAVFLNDESFFTLLFVDTEDFDIIPDTLYISHVHNTSCDTMPPGGPHWMFEILPPPAVVANELWVNYTRGADQLNSVASGTDVTAIPSGYDGSMDEFVLSVVFHDTPTMGAPRLICLDMTNFADALVPTEGPTPTDSASSLGLSVLLSIALVLAITL